MEPKGSAGRLRKAALIGSDNGGGVLSAPKWYPVATFVLGASLRLSRGRGWVQIAWL